MDVIVTAMKVYFIIGYGYLDKVIGMYKRSTDNFIPIVRCYYRCVRVSSVCSIVTRFSTKKQFEKQLNCGVINVYVTNKYIEKKFRSSKTPFS